MGVTEGEGEQGAGTGPLVGPRPQFPPAPSEPRLGPFEAPRGPCAGLFDAPTLHPMSGPLRDLRHQKATPCARCPHPIFVWRSARQHPSWHGREDPTVSVTGREANNPGQGTPPPHRPASPLPPGGHPLLLPNSPRGRKPHLRVGSQRGTHCPPRVCPPFQRTSHPGSGQGHLGPCSWDSVPSKDPVLGVLPPASLSHSIAPLICRQPVRTATSRQVLSVPVVRLAVRGCLPFLLQPNFKVHKSCLQSAPVRQSRGLDGMRSPGDPHSLRLGMQTGPATAETEWRLLRKGRLELPCGPALSPGRLPET